MNRPVVVADGSPRNSIPCNGSWSQFMSIRWKTLLSMNGRPVVADGSLRLEIGHSGTGRPNGL
ncbi:MAG: hypothetical protein EXS36_16240 [Pedosphaera sp.]|nr:hypothetical protein [Pedosphaera sp.]